MSHFRCPKEEPHNCNGGKVDRDYCESFGQGKGCKYKDTCEAYEKQSNDIEQKIIDDV